MKQISVSVDVYAAIWSARMTGEDDENSILHRLLISTPDDNNDEAAFAGLGYSDPRHDVVFGEGQEIGRVYKGREYRAVARDNAWHMDGQRYDSLNKLSRAVTGKIENAWVNWYIYERGRPDRLVDALRGKEDSDKTRIIAQAHYSDYHIKRYENGTVVVDQRGSYAGAARPLLSKIALKIGVSIYNSNGHLRNTRQLGAEVIRVLTAKTPEELGL